MCAFNDTKSPGDVVRSSDWNAFVDFTEATSSNAYKHSSNSNIHLTSVQKTDLTDGGDTTLHIHDSRYYTETEVDNTFYNKTWIDSLSGSIDTRIDTLEAQTEFVPTNYITSANAIERFPDSSQVNRSLINSISSNLDSRIDNLFNWSSNKGIYYPSGVGAGLSGSYSAHKLDTTIHFTKSSLDDDYQGSSQAKIKFAGSSNINRNLLDSISSNLDSRIDSLYDWSSNALTLYGASSHTHDSRYYTESESLSLFAGSSNINRNLLNTISSNIVSQIGSSFDPTEYITSANSLSKFAASGKIRGLQVSEMTPAAGKVLKWDNINNYWSSQTDETGGGGGGAGQWAYLNAGTGISPQWDSNTYGLSSAGSDITISVAGYSTISSQAEYAYSEIIASGNQWYAAYKHSASAKGLFYPSSLGHYYTGSGTKLTQAIASSARVYDRFDHTLYVASSVATSKFYDSESDLTALLNDNYAGSSNINRTLLNTISSNLDTRIDSLFNFSSNKSLYYPSSIGHSLDLDYHGHSSNTSIHNTLGPLVTQAASGTHQTHALIQLTDVIPNFDTDVYHGSGLKWNKVSQQWEVALLAGGGGAPIDNYTVKVDAGATADYIGATNSTGVLRTDTTLNYTDGGDYITIGVDTSKFAPSTLTDTRLDSIFNYSSNAKNLYANSSNVRFRFVASSTAIAKFAPSRSVNNGLQQILDGSGSIAHGLISTPNYWNVRPSGNVNFGINTKVDATNIYVNLTTQNDKYVYWYAST